MKSFKQILSEVAEPKSDDEANFKDKHEIEVIDHPEAEESQFTSDTDTKRRIADYSKGEDEDVYESKVIYKTSADDRDELDDIHSDLKQKYPKKKITTTKNKSIGGWDIEVLDESVKFNGRTFKDLKTFNSDKDANKFLEKNDDYGVVGEKDGKVYVAKNSDKGVKEATTLDPVDKTEIGKKFDKRSDKDIDNDGDVDDSDEYLHKRRKAISKAMKKDNMKESFSIETGAKVSMKKSGKTVYGKVIGKEQVMGEPGVEVKWDSGTKGRFKNSAFAAATMDRKADYSINESSVSAVAQMQKLLTKHADQKMKVVKDRSGYYHVKQDTGSGTSKVGPFHTTDDVLKWLKKELKEDMNESDEKRTAISYDTYDEYAVANKKKGVQVLPKTLWNRLKKEKKTDESTADFITKAAAKKKDKKKFELDGEELQEATDNDFVDALISAIEKNARKSEFQKASQAFEDWGNRNKRSFENLTNGAGVAGTFFADLQVVLDVRVGTDESVDEDTADFITKAAAAKKKDKKKFELDGEEFPVTIKDKNVDKIIEAKGDMAEIGRKLQKMAPKEKNDMISNAMANLADHLESFGTSFGAKNMRDLEKKTGLTANIIRMLINKADSTASISESATISPAKVRELIMEALGKTRLPVGHSYKSSISSNGDFVVEDASGRKIGRIASGDYDLYEKVNSGPKEAVDIISKSISMNSKTVEEALKAAKLDAVNVATALKGRKTIKVDDLSDLIMGYTFNGSFDKRDLADIKKKADAAFTKNESEMAGWIAIYKGKKLEIPKDKAKDLYGAKMYAAKELKVPKSRMGVLAIKPAYNEAYDASLDEAVAKIACTKCDEVSTAAAWKKNNGVCPKCNKSTQGVAESLDEAASVKKMSDAQLKNWLKKNDTDEAGISPAFGQQLIHARKEMKRRGLKIETTNLAEAFKKGSLTLDDGSSVKVSDSDADILNQMFDDLNSKNKREMLKVATKDKNGFSEILGFAKEAL